jgi:putative DNA-invertase from lambdoid prophage Rac
MVIVASTLNLVESLHRLASAGVRFIATTQSIDTDESNPTSKLLLYILAAVAEFEREMIRERVVAGLTTAKRNGKQLGRRELVFNRGRALSLHRAGKSIRQIADALHVNRGTLHRFLLEQDRANGTKPTTLVRLPKTT